MSEREGVTGGTQSKIGRVGDKIISSCANAPSILQEVGSGEGGEKERRSECWSKGERRSKIGRVGDEIISSCANAPSVLQEVNNGEGGERRSECGSKGEIRSVGA